MWQMIALKKIDFCMKKENIRVTAFRCYNSMNSGQISASTDTDDPSLLLSDL